MIILIQVREVSGMVAIKCEVCDGKGKIEQNISTGKPKYTTSGITGMFIGYETVKTVANCPNCGGSGCKWVD